MLTLYVPRSLLGNHATALDRVGPDIPDTGLGALLADYLLNLYRHLPEILPAQLPKLVEATISVILACTMPTPDRLDGARATINQTMFERARQMIKKELHSPNLNPEYLARALGLSRSKLYRMFEGEGGVAHFIQRRRLHDAHALLSSIHERIGLQELAETRGFQDAATFSRAFRREFGYSPRDARDARGTVAQPKVALVRTGIDNDPTILTRLLTAL